MLGHPTLAVARPNMGDLGSEPEPRARHPAHPGKIQLITEGFPDIRAEVTAADGRFWTTCSCLRIWVASPRYNVLFPRAILMSCRLSR